MTDKPKPDVQTELLQLATAVRDLIAQARDAGQPTDAAAALERAQGLAGMLVAEISDTPLQLAAPLKAGEAAAALAVLEKSDLEAAYASWLGQRQKFVQVDPEADDERAGLLRLASVHWTAFEEQTRRMGELLDRALAPGHEGQERMALSGAKALVVLQYQQAFRFCETTRRLVEAKA